MFHLVGFALLVALSTSAFKPQDTSSTDKLAADSSKKQLEFTFGSHTPAADLVTSCQPKDIIHRKEWHSLTDAEQLDYIQANLCMYRMTTKNASFAPGSRSRVDDFAAQHIAQAPFIHGTGSFLTFHRYLLHAWETALREECGYKGRQPYYNWGKAADNPKLSPLLDGGPQSLGGDGEYKPHPGYKYGVPPYVNVPPGNGSGCVLSGPFKNLTVNLGPGPGSATATDVPPNPRPDGLGYNPRCLRRDISIYLSHGSLQDANTTYLIDRVHNLTGFQQVLQGDFVAPTNQMGAHPAGHNMIGGDPGGDIYASILDPFFWVHHAQVDRVWWIWQNQDPGVRTDIVAGTRTRYNNPPSPNATLDDPVVLGSWIAPDSKIRDLTSTLRGPFCYQYV